VKEVIQINGFSVIGCHFEGFNTAGVYFYSNATNGICSGNYFIDSTPYKLETGYTLTRVKALDNIFTENKGTATITAGNTYVDVTHGLAQTPSQDDIQVTPLTNLAGKSFWVDNIGATTFRINISATDTVNHVFSWRAELS